jgi:hypothetical protein
MQKSCRAKPLPPYINACDPLVAATTHKWDLSDTTTYFIYFSILFFSFEFSSNESVDKILFLLQESAI